MWENNDQEKENYDRLNEFGRLKCPMCKGRGFFDPSCGTVSRTTEIKKSGFGCGQKLPKIETDFEEKRRIIKPLDKLNLPSIRNVKNLPEVKSFSKINGSNLHNKISREIIITEESDASTEIRKRIPSGGSDPDGNLVPTPKTPENPKEILKSSMIKLKTNDWNEAVGALRNIVQISRYHPNMLENSMAQIYRGAMTLLKGFRSVAVRTACQAVNELFANVPDTRRPEFDELVNALLRKTADTNKFIRRDADEALDSMVVNIPPVHTVRTICQKGIVHKNPEVRSSAARLLVCVVGVAGVDNIYSGSKETRSRIFGAAVRILQDGSGDVRNYGKRLIKMLMRHEDFDRILQTEIHPDLLKQVDKTLVTLRYRIQ